MAELPSPSIGQGGGSIPKPKSSSNGGNESSSSAFSNIIGEIGSGGSIARALCSLEGKPDNGHGGELIIRILMGDHLEHLFAAPGSGQVIVTRPDSNDILPRDYIRILMDLPVRSPDKQDLSTRLRTLAIPSPLHYALPLFDDDGDDDGGHSEPALTWAVLTSAAYRANDDWGREYPKGEILYSTTAEAEPEIEGLPRFVLPVGRPPASVMTYIVVMDITSPDKPLWLVHDAYTSCDDNDHGNLPAERLAPRGLGFVGDTVFDVAPLAKSVKEWHDWAIASSGDAREALERVRRRIEAEGKVVKPLISITWHNRVVEAVKEGYKQHAGK
ncbi:hypothetical protein UCRPA7_5584 [Phaeoacremonium minimum UCRPA7]|uniref:Uncharacterized protein n=1 Tax=Phaeoacremonium minimum (strain UCR-PA7) TaxID=1286976 RepID=R8BHT0_PHAM7|nr:hypothetical protein UCRPA7_5584 [Phaeoacremonium minimum UCRPA7]EON98895.1 hypothetical protein UCRPA7_5584 [Phaeoacremonium minimum UCRPA7]